MKTRIFEATNGAAYGKFLVGRFDEEWKHRPQVEDLDFNVSLLRREGWRKCFLLLDLSNPGVGAIFSHHSKSIAKYDVEQKGIQKCICWLYTDFLNWIYQQKLEEFNQWPALVEFELFPAREAASAE